MRAGIVALTVAVAACVAGPPGPAALDTKTEACRSCRMAASDPRFAAQIVAPSEEPRFFDDVGCLRDFLAREAALPGGSAAYVADHRTRAWVPAARAVYTRVPDLETPMGSHLVAHADGASREADLEARGGKALSPSEVFGPGGPPDGR